MMKEKDLLLISSLRMNSRESLTNISRRIRVPISTLFDRLKSQEGGVIKRHTALLDFSKLGFSTRASIILKVDKNEREAVSGFIQKHVNVNSAYKVNNGFDYMIEAVFKSLQELEEFIDELEERFRIRQKQVYYIIDEIKKEDFLSRPELIGLESSSGSKQ